MTGTGRRGTSGADAYDAVTAASVAFAAQRVVNRLATGNPADALAELLGGPFIDERGTPNYRNLKMLVLCLGWMATQTRPGMVKEHRPIAGPLLDYRP